jgi:AcrR family transcriptional regulator
MLQPGAPKFRRRKADRPGEIVQAALEVFAERGFAAAKLEEIARRAGVSKGALYLYFET